MSNRNPGATGKFLDKQYVHIPSDQLILRVNIQELVKVQEEVEKEEQDIKDHLNSLFSDKLKDGKGSQRDFDEESITVLTILRKKISKTFSIYWMQRTNIRICFVDTLVSLNQKSVAKGKIRERHVREKLDAEKKRISV